MTNTGKTPLPVETALREDCSSTRTASAGLAKAGDDFLVFPPQAIIPPGGTQVFRLQWVGEPKLGQERELHVLRLPGAGEDAAKGESKVQVVMSFGVVINVARRPGRAEPSRSSAPSITTDKQGKRRAVVTVENSSTRRMRCCREGKLSLAGNGWTQSLTQTEIREKIGHRPRAARQAPQVRDADGSAGEASRRCRRASTTSRSAECTNRTEVLRHNR